MPEMKKANCKHDPALSMSISSDEPIAKWCSMCGSLKTIHGYWTHPTVHHVGYFPAGPDPQDEPVDDVVARRKAFERAEQP